MGSDWHKGLFRIFAGRIEIAPAGIFSFCPKHAQRINILFGKRFKETFGNIADALADDLTFIAAALNGNNIQHIFEIIHNISSRIAVIRNNIKAHQAHNVVNPQGSRRVHIGAENFNKRFIAAFF